MKLIATHTDSQVAGAAIAALTGLGFSNIRVDVAPGRAMAFHAAAGTIEDKFDTIVVPGGKQGIRDCFFGENKWRWVRVDRRKLDAIRYVAIYETVLDAENNNAPGGSGAVIAYAPVVGYEMAADGPYAGKYYFDLGEIVTLDRPIPSGDPDLRIRDRRYTMLEDLLEADTLADLFERN